MVENKVDKDVSIVQIIQDMVREGESEEKIIQTLKELGVEPDKAKRLLLLGQADTFALLRGEISKIVLDDLEKQKPALEKFLQSASQKAGQDMKKTVSAEVMVDIAKYEKSITGQSTTFQEQVNENLRRFSELNERVRENSDNLNARMAKIEQDLDEMKIKGVGARGKTISLVLLALGVVFVLAAFYLFFTNFKSVLSIDSLIVTIVMSLVGITLMFVSTL